MVNNKSSFELNGNYMSRKRNSSTRGSCVNFKAMYLLAVYRLLIVLLLELMSFFKLTSLALKLNIIPRFGDVNFHTQFFTCNLKNMDKIR